jgi:FlaA1/EpsC-like NDP-sugar epimerase
MNVSEVIARDNPLFAADLQRHAGDLQGLVEGAKFLVIGGAGSIGQAVAKEVFRRNPRCLHVVDISENNLVELVRGIRSTSGYGFGDFRTFVVDAGSREFEALFNTEGPYDYVFNLSAMKHVRSERDPFTLMRMLQVNVVNTVKIAELTRGTAKNYFCVSTDKAANPINMMGASKRIMESFLARESLRQNISMARFANVAFSDGSLLHGFNQRFLLRQPISAPTDVRRYFITPSESGELCLLSGLLGYNRDVFFPKLNEDLHLATFSEIARRYLHQLGFEVFECDSENEARERADELIGRKLWPCYFFTSDTTGEKAIEEFFTAQELIDVTRFQSIGIIRSHIDFEAAALDAFSSGLENIRQQTSWSKSELLDLVVDVLPNFSHHETGKYLDQRM